MHPALRPDIQEVIDQAKQRCLGQREADRNLEEIEQREARGELVRGVARSLPRWTRQLSGAELVGWLTGDLRSQADHWAPGAPGSHGSPDKPCSPCLLLMGTTGVGKTRCAASIVRRLVGRGVKSGGPALEFAAGIVWADADRLAQARNEHPRGKGEAPEVTEAIKASLLVLDDLGQERDPEVVREVIRAREKRAVPIITTTGLAPSGLTARYGADIVRRLHERHGQPGTVINLHDQEQP